MRRNCCLGGFAAAALAGLLWSGVGQAQDPPRRAFSGLDMGLGNLYRLSNAQSRSISPENFTGEKGKAAMATEGTGKNAARELGQGWKVSPSVRIKARSTFTLAEIAGPGAIQQIWMTPAPLDKTRFNILRFYWDDEAEPSVEVPLGDFFACGWGRYCQINSLAVCVNPGSAFNCYWNMPFRKKAKITMENLDEKDMVLYYQINYTLTDVPADAACFHAQFRRVHRLPAKTVYTILDRVQGRGQYVGTYLAWEVRSPGWWGEGEIKFFMDGDEEFPTICGTGTAIHGWNGAREVFVNNQGWVGKGSAIWIGTRAMEAVAESMDGRGQKTKLEEMIFKKYNSKNISQLLKFIFEDLKSDLPKLAVSCDEAANREDKVAQEILKQAGKEIALAVRVAAAKLQFVEQVPLVLAGGVYKSRWMADAAVAEIERYYPGKFDIVFVGDPVAGAVKLALENAKKI